MTTKKLATIAAALFKLCQTIADYCCADNTQQHYFPVADAY